MVVNPAGHMAGMKDTSRTIRSTDWYTKGIRSAARSNDFGEMTLWFNRERYGQGQEQTKFEDSGRGLFPAVEGHSANSTRLEKKESSITI